MKLYAYAISGAIGNSGISVELFVYRTLYVKYIQTFCRTCELEKKMSLPIMDFVLIAVKKCWTYGISLKLTSFASFSAN